MRESYRYRAFILAFMVAPFFMAIAARSALAVDPDKYEVDDTYSQASVLNVDDVAAQVHNFHYSGDSDWTVFYGLAGKQYIIFTENVGSDCDVLLELYDADGTSSLDKADDYGKGENERLQIPQKTSRDGLYYVKVYDYNGASGDNYQYDLRLTKGEGPAVDGFLEGIVQGTSGIIEYAEIFTDGGGSAVSWPGDGAYSMSHSQGTYNVTAQATGYYSEVKAMYIGTNTELNFTLTPDGPTTTTTTTIPTTTSTTTSTTSPTTTPTTTTWPTTTTTAASTTSSTTSTTWPSSTTSTTYPTTTTSTTTTSTSTTTSTTTTLPDPCHNCNGIDVVLQGVTFSATADCDCVATRSMNIGSGVVIKDGAKVKFRAPEVSVHPDFHAETGSSVNFGQ